MLSFLPGWVKAPIAFLLICVNTVVLCLTTYVVGFVKILWPTQPGKLACAKAMARVAELWIQVNLAVVALTQKIQWNVELDRNVDFSQSYLVLANHQSWVDIFVLHRIFNRKIPFLRFFLKRQLMWVPFLGAAWWALDFPFMRRFSKEYLKKHPEKSGQDLESIRRSCEKFRKLPTAILIFAEGTRFSKKKHDSQKSPFEYLLRPKTGGFLTTLDVMGENFCSVLDVTIIYPKGIVGFWGMLMGHISEVIVRVKSHPVPKRCEEKIEEQNDEIKHWMYEQWKKKDTLMAQVQQGAVEQTA